MVSIFCIKILLNHTIIFFIVSSDLRLLAHNVGVVFKFERIDQKILEDVLTKTISIVSYDYAQFNSAKGELAEELKKLADLIRQELGTTA